MTTIQECLDKAQAYIEYYDAKDKGLNLRFNTDALPKLAWEKWAEIYIARGIHILDRTPDPPVVRKLSFDEWYKSGYKSGSLTVQMVKDLARSLRKEQTPIKIIKYANNYYNFLGDVRRDIHS